MVLGLSRLRAVRSRRRIPLVFLIGIVFVGLLWFAPTIAVNSSLKSTILAHATERFDGKISTGYISAGWFSSIVVNDLVMQDKQGEPILLASSARTESSLLSLMVDQTKIGVIRINQPKLHLVFKDNTSNLEDAIKPLLSRQASDSGPLDITIELVDGTVTALDESTDRKWQAEGINITLASRGADATIEAHFEANVTGSDAQSGSLVADIAWQHSTDGSGISPGRGNLTAEVRRFDLSVLESLLRRIAPGISLSGTLGANVQLDWGAEGETAIFDAISIGQLQLVAPQWLGPDRLALQAINLQARVTRQDEFWQVEDLAVASDVMNLRASGKGVTRTSPLEDLSAVLKDVWQRGEYQVVGYVDVARLAQILPNTLRIRESVQLTSGRISGSLSARQGNEGSQWHSEITALDLAGTHDGLPIRFDEPIEIGFTARRSGGQTIVDQLDCHAGFFSLSASGTQQQGRLSAEGDLTQFFKEISKFVDVGDLGLAGSLQADIQWRQVTAGQIALQATAEATNFELTHSDQPPWRESRMRIEIGVTGMQDDVGIRGLQKASLRVESAGDVLLVELLEPVDPLAADTRLPLRARLQGELRSWRSRLRPWLPATDVSLDGIVDATLQGTGSKHLVEIDMADIRVTQFNLVGAGLNIHEPEVQLKTQAVLNLDEMEFVTSSATFASSSLSFQAQDVRLKHLSTQTEISGVAGFRADLGRLTNCFSAPNQNVEQRFSGEVIGQIRMTHQEGLTMADVQADIREFAYETLVASSGPMSNQAAGPAGAIWKPMWNESLVEVTGLVGYVHADPSVRLDKFAIAGSSLSLGARGTLSDPFGRCYLDVEGRISYDLERITQKLRPQLGEYIQLKGRDAKPFKIRGPLLTVTETLVSARSGSTSSVPQVATSVLTELIAQGSLAWTSAEIQGIAIGPGQIETEMADGIATARPFQVPLAEGMLHLTPRLVMNRSPMMLQLAHGSGADNVRITNDMCQGWLKYVAPLVADATSAEGTFSVRLEGGASVPLDSPQSADVKGKLIVHKAQIGPGPLARELLLVANQIRALIEGQPLSALGSASGIWLDLPEQEIDFQLIDNRVQHQGLEMRVKDIVIRTRGSVGIDQSLSMVAEIPIRDEWLSSNRFLASLKGRSLRIPIRGTLSKPRLERSALEQLTQQTLTNAASQLLEKELNRGIGRGLQGLEKLFGPQQ